jgi:predicted transcriptional regulator
MTHWTIEIDDDVAQRVADEATRRGVAPEALVGETVAEKFAPRRRRLAFAGIGSSGTSRGAAHTDELLAEGFGRD